MSDNMQRHNHGGKNHLLGMLGIGALVLIVLLATGSSIRTALPFRLLTGMPADDGRNDLQDDAGR